MTKKSPPKTAFYKVTTLVEGDEAEAVVVEAISEAEASSYIASCAIKAEPYPVDKLVAYIQSGGVPIKVPPKQKRPYSWKRSAKTVPRSTEPSDEVA